MSEILQNEKVRDEYKILICVKEEEKDMESTVSEFCSSYGYIKIENKYDNDNCIVVLRKKNIK